MTEITSTIDDVSANIDDLLDELLAFGTCAHSAKTTTSVQTIEDIKHASTKIHSMIRSSIRKTKQFLKSVQSALKRSGGTQKTSRTRSASSRQTKTKSRSSASSGDSSDSDGPARPSSRRNLLRTFLHQAVNPSLAVLHSGLDFLEATVLKTFELVHAKFRLLPQARSASYCAPTPPLSYIRGVL